MRPLTPTLSRGEREKQPLTPTLSRGESVNFLVLVVLLGFWAPPEARGAAAGVATQDEIRELNKTGSYAAAEAAARELLAEAETRDGSESFQAAEVLDLLVEALYRAGKAAESESRALAERAVAIKEKARGPDHLEVARSLNQLGNLLLLAGDYFAAKPVYQRALAIREAALEPPHVDLAISLHNLGLVYWQLGEFAEARPLYERALAIDEQRSGPAHPDVAHVLNNIGLLLRNLGDYAAARRHLERALAIREQALGPEHPDVAHSLNDLAGLLKEIDRSEVDEKPLRSPPAPRREHGGVRARSQLEALAGAPRQQVEHPPVLLGRLHRRRRLALDLSPAPPGGSRVGVRGCIRDSQASSRSVFEKSLPTARSGSPDSLATA